MLNLFYVLLFLAVIIAFDRHRQHDDALDPRANAGDRAPARGRREPAAGALDDPVGGGDHRAARHAARRRDRAVLRLGGDQGAARLRASRSSRPRSVQLVVIVVLGGCSRVVAAILPGPARGQARRPERDLDTSNARVRRRAPNRSLQRGVLGAHLLARGRPGSAPSRRAASRRSSRGCAPRAGRRCVALPTATVATGMPAGICTIDSSESRPSSCASGTGTPITGSGVIDAVMPGRCGGAARARDDHPQPAVGRRRGRTRTSRRGCGARRRSAPRARRRTRRARRSRPASPAGRSRCP